MLSLFLGSFPDMHVGGHSTWASPFGPRHLPLSQMRKTIHRTGTRGRSGVQAARGMSQPIACILMTTRRDHSGLVRMKMSFRSICMTSNHSIISKRQPISIWVSFCLSIFGFQFIICFIISLALASIFYCRGPRFAGGRLRLAHDTYR